MSGAALRIAILTWDTPPRPSGLGRAAFEIAASLRDAGAGVTLVDASRPSGTAERIEAVGVIGCAPRETGLAPWLRRRAAIGHLVAPRAFAAALEGERFDIVEATNWYAPAAALPANGPPLVVRNSTPAIDAWPQARGLRDRLDLAFAHRLERRTARRAAALISNTRSHAALIERIYRPPPETLHAVIGLALDPATLARGERAGPSRADPFRSLFVGRIEHRKGFAEALAGHLRFAQALHAAGRRLPAFDIAGVQAGELAPHLDDVPPEIAATVVAHGRVDDDELHDLYAAATVVLAPSRYESYGLVYREAAAFGRPLVACAEDPAATDFVRESRCGVLAERCAADAIAVRLRLLHDDAALREDCARRGRAAAAGLSRERLAAETLHVYEAALARASA